MHAIPLARLGYAVTAVDSSRLLLSQLQQLSKNEGHDIHAIEADVLDFATHVHAPVALVLCMGDTLTHLSSTDAVERLCSQVAACLHLRRFDHDLPGLFSATPRARPSIHSRQE